MDFDIDRQIKNIEELEKFIVEWYGDLLYEQLENEKVRIKVTHKDTKYSFIVTTNIKITNKLTNVACIIELPEQTSLEWKQQTRLNWRPKISALVADFYYNEVTKELVINKNSCEIIIMKNIVGSG